MHDFEYCAPGSLKEAIQIMSANTGFINLLAGGTDLIVAMRIGRKRPNLVMDVKAIPELTDMSLRENNLTLGGAVTCRSIYKNRTIAAKFPALVDSTSLIGGIQIQGRATVGGNLCNAAPSADTIPTLIAYGAKAHIAGANASQDVPVEDICIAPGKTALAANEILVRLIVPIPPRNSGAAFLRFIPRNEMDIAVVNVAASVELDNACEFFGAVRIAIGSVAPTPLFVRDAGEHLKGKPISDSAIAEAAMIATEAARPITDMRGTIEHRKQLVRVLVTRAINAAVLRARGATV